MPSQSETGHARNVARFGNMIEYCIGYGPRYNPSNSTLTLINLEIKRTASKTAIDDVAQKKSDYSDVENARVAAFEDLQPYATRLVNALETTKASADKIEDAREFLRKLRGGRASEKKIGPNGEDNSISTSQLSYDSLIEHFYGLSLILASEPTYTPNEPDLTLAAVNAKHDALVAANKAVAKAATNLSNARIARDRELYAEETGLIDTAKGVKKYVSSVFGTNSPEFKQISGIEFREPPK